MKFFSRLRCKLFLFRWSGISRRGRNRRIRINRRYMYLHSDLLDLTWSMREMKSDGTKGIPVVISERVGFEGLMHAIKRIENKQFPETLQRFAKEIGEEL